MSDRPSKPSADSASDVDSSSAGRFGVPRWVLALIPIVLIALVLIGLFAVGPGFDRGEPVPDMTISYHTIPDGDTIILHATNNGGEEITISQVFVDGAYWNFDVEKTNSLPLLGSGDGPNTLAQGESAQIEIPYHLTLDPANEIHIDVILGGGETFGYTVTGVQTTSGFAGDLLWTLAVIGLFVGVIPVAIGMLWFPYIRSLSDRWLYAILAFAAGVLAYLAIASTLEAFELADRIPGAYAGEALIALGILATVLIVQSVSEWRKANITADHHGLWIAYLVAFGIGLHNLAEGLAIGGAYAVGQMSFAVFLVVGFMLHNVTEGPAIVAPLARADARDGARPALYHFALLGLIGGGPVILGGWIGGFTLSPTIGALFLAIGAGAILQVIWELIQLVRSGGSRASSASNLWAFVIGAAVMYGTGLFVAV